MQRRPWAWVVRRLLDRRPWVGRDLGGEATGGPSALGGESTGGALGVEPPTGGPEEELPWPTAAGGYLGVDDDSASAARAFAFLSSAAAISRLGC